MKDNPKLKIANILRYTARSVLLTLASLIFVFALLSGSELYGGGLKGILMNSPNAIPWAILLAFAWIAWRWELLGGTIISLMGIFTIFMFDALEEPFVFLIISLPLIILGGFFIGSYYLTRSK